MMTKNRNVIIPTGAGLAGGIFLFSIYLGIVSLAESPQHALEFFWQDRWLAIPIILGFGIQVALFVILKRSSFLHLETVRPHGVMTGASGISSTIGMTACCAHHVVDILPIIGLTSVATFLAAYRTNLMLVSLILTLIGIGLMLIKLLMNHQKVTEENPISRVSEV